MFPMLSHTGGRMSESSLVKNERVLEIVLRVSVVTFECDCVFFRRVDGGDAAGAGCFDFAILSAIYAYSIR